MRGVKPGQNLPTAGVLPPSRHNPCCIHHFKSTKGTQWHLLVDGCWHSGLRHAGCAPTCNSLQPKEPVTKQCCVVSNQVGTCQPLAATILSSPRHSAYTVQKHTRRAMVALGPAAGLCPHMPPHACHHPARFNWWLAHCSTRPSKHTTAGWRGQFAHRVQRFLSIAKTATEQAANISSTRMQPNLCGQAAMQPSLCGQAGNAAVKTQRLLCNTHTPDRLVRDWKEATSSSRQPQINNLNKALHLPNLGLTTRRCPVQRSQMQQAQDSAATPQAHSSSPVLLPSDTTWPPGEGFRTIRVWSKGTAVLACDHCREHPKT